MSVCSHCSLKTTKVGKIYHRGNLNICTKCQNVMAINPIVGINLKCVFETGPRPDLLI